MSGAKFTLVQDENVNLVINQGATINFSIEWTSSTVGFVASMCIKAGYGEPDITTFTIANSRVIIGGANKLITFVMTVADSALLPVLKNGIYGIKITDNNNVVYPEIYGKCEIKPLVC